MAFWLRTCLLSLLSLVQLTEGAQVKGTPLQRVVSLLKGLSAKVSAEGKEEAAEYDKFACFCKEQIDQKQYSMSQSESKIEHLKTDIEALETARSSLAANMLKLSLEMSDLEDQITDSKEETDQHHVEYLKKAEDMTEAIEACGGAISAFKQSKSQMLHAKLDLAQVTKGLVLVMERQPLLAAAPGAIALTAILNKKKQAPKYEYHSNDLIAILEDTLASFKAMKKSLDLDASKVSFILDQKMLGLVTKRKLVVKERAAADLLSSAKTEKLQNAQVTLTDEDDDYWADVNFLSQLNDECKDKATAFDQRSRVRSNELTALATATRDLQVSGVPNYNGNRALIGLQMAAAGKVGRLSSQPVMLVQLGSAQKHRSFKLKALDRVQSFLADAADRIGSRTLTNIAWRVGASLHSGVSMLQDTEDVVSKIDNFEHVRGLVKDLLNKLQGDATDEAEHKAKCDQVMKKRTAQRDDANDGIEVAAGNLAQMRADKKVIEEDSQVLAEQIAEIKKGKFDALQLYNADQKAMNDAIDMCETGTASIEYALQVLGTFYSEQSEAARQPDSDGAYHGASAESEGVMGMLEVILSDFKRSEASTKSSKKDATLQHSKFEKASEADILLRNERTDKNEVEIRTLGVLITEEETTLMEKKNLLSSAASVLDDWSSECVETETWKEREAARQEEIKSLQEAQTMLED